MASRIINYHGNEKTYNKEAVDELLETKQDTLVIDTSLDSTSEHPVQNKAIANAIQLEADTRQHADDVLEGKMGDLNDLTTVAKTDLVTAINEVNEKVTPVDTAMSDTSEKPVQNKVIKEYVDDSVETLEEKHVADMQLETDTRHHVDDLLDERVTNLEDTLLPMDEVPTEDSEKPVKSGGTWDAIRFASVKVGETMFWPQFKTETRTVVSDSPFTYEINGVEHTVNPVTPATVELQIADNVPDGWRACDGTAVLDVVDYPELAEFFGSANITEDDKIWIPYCAKRIIKITY